MIIKLLRARNLFGKYKSFFNYVLKNFVQAETPQYTT